MSDKQVIDQWQVCQEYQQLLTSESHAWLRRLTQSFDVADEVYEACYLPLIQSFAECVQTLPQMNMGQDISMLNAAFKRVGAVLSLKKDKIKKCSKAIQPRIIYALVSSALLFEVGRVTLTRSCFIGDDEGNHIRPWDPVAENMRDVGSRYKVRLTQDLGRPYMNAITPLIAVRLMPKLGLTWLHEDQALFLSWTHALTRFEDSFEDWGLRYNLRDIYEFMQSIELQELSAQSIKDKQDAGEAFWAWLQEQVNEGKLPLNQSDTGVYVVDGGVFIDYERIFRVFSAGHPQHGSWSDVSAQFSQLGLTTGTDFQSYVVKQARSAMSFYQQAQKQASKGNAGVINGFKILQSELYFQNNVLNKMSQLQQKSAAEGKQTTRLFTAILGEMDQKFLPPKT